MPGALGHCEAKRLRCPSSGTRAFAGLVLAALTLGAGGCGLPQLPAYPGGMRPTARLGLAQDRPSDGALRPGDELIVETADGEERRQVRARVSAVGDLHVDSERDVVVAGLSLDSAEARVAETLRRTDRHAEVDLQFANRPTQRVIALGALTRPGPIEAGPRTRVADVIAAAGGLLMLQTEGGGTVPLDVADLDRAALVRNGTALPIDMREALRAKPGHNVYVHPGDLLYVPFATENTVSVFGQVGQPRVLPHQSGLRLTEALAAAGGITVGGDTGDIRLVRGPVEAPRVYQASLADIADGEQNDAALAPGDVVFVEDHIFEDVGEVFAVLTPFTGLIFVVTTFLIATD